MKVYVDISIYEFTDLRIIWNGALIGCRFRNEIFKPFVAFYAAAIEDNFMLMDGNCRQNNVNMLDDYHSEEEIVQNGMGNRACLDNSGRLTADCLPREELEIFLLEE